MRKVVLIPLLVLISLSFLNLKKADAQQISLFNHYFFNPTLYNPAFTGHKETTNIMLVSRQQWSRFKNAPKLNLINIDGSIYNNRMGLGAILYSETKGINQTIGGNLLYSYHVKINEQSKLNLGVSFRFISHRVNFSQATVENVSDPTLYNSKQSNTNFDGNVGLAYFWKGLELGVALDQILKTKTSFINDFGNNISYTPSYHYINSLKYTFLLNKEKKLLLSPQILVRYVPNAPLQFELNTNVYYKDMFWVGATYKNDYAIAANVGINLFKKISVGYSYDVITSDIGQYAGVSHELMLNYKFGKKEKKEKKEKIEEKVEKEIEEEHEQEIITEEPAQEKVEKEIEKEKIKKPATEKKDDEVIILTAPAKEFISIDKKEPESGFYVIVGSFVYADFAEKYKEKIKQKGYPQVGRFNSPKRNYNYVYMFKESSLDNALGKIKEAQENGSSQAWIIILTE